MKKIINFLFLISIIFPQNENFEISNISVYGNIEMSEEDIINFSGLSPNSSINAINIQNAINRLWLLNRFENIFPKAITASSLSYYYSYRIFSELLTNIVIIR